MPHHTPDPVPDDTPDPLTPELAPFVAQARARLEADTEGLEPEALVRHLEDTVAAATVQASRLGFAFPVAEVDQGPSLGDGPIVLVQHIDD